MLATTDNSNKEDFKQEERFRDNCLGQTGWRTELGCPLERARLLSSNASAHGVGQHAQLGLMQRQRRDMRAKDRALKAYELFNTWEC